MEWFAENKELIGSIAGVIILSGLDAFIGYRPNNPYVGIIKRVIEAIRNGRKNPA